MTAPTFNAPGKHAIASVIANSTFTLANVASPNTSIETVTSINISKIFWTGPWTISWGNTVVFQTANNNGVWELDKAGMLLAPNCTNSIVVNSTSTSATLVLKISKQSTILTPANNEVFNWNP